MEKVGFQIRTDDGVINTSGEPIAVYGIHIISGETAGVVILRNGTSTAGTAVIQEEGTISAGVTFHFGGSGVVFPSGCFVDVDANVSSVTVFYQRVK